MPPKRLWLLALAIGAMDASAACELQRYASLPVNISHGRAYISGSVNGVDALFFADSGAFSACSRTTRRDASTCDEWRYRRDSKCAASMAVRTSP
jgi:hypothetical protein